MPLVATPVLADPSSLEEENVFDFSSGYIQRSLHIMPKSTAALPWRLSQNYVRDRVDIGPGRPVHLSAFDQPLVAVVAGATGLVGQAVLAALLTADTTPSRGHAAAPAATGRDNGRYGCRAVSVHGASVAEAHRRTSEQTSTTKAARQKQETPTG